MFEVGKLYLDRRQVLCKILRADEYKLSVVLLMDNGQWSTEATHNLDGTYGDSVHSSLSRYDLLPQEVDINKQPVNTKVDSPLFQPGKMYLDKRGTVCVVKAPEHNDPHDSIIVKMRCTNSSIESLQWTVDATHNLDGTFPYGAHCRAPSYLDSYSLVPGEVDIEGKPITEARQTGERIHEGVQDSVLVERNLCPLDIAMMARDDRPLTRKEQDFKNKQAADKRAKEEELAKKTASKNWPFPSNYTKNEQK